MSRKNFKQNPALQFISSEIAVNEPNTENTYDTLNDENTDNESKVYNTHKTQQSSESEGGRELKKKRLNLILQPSVFEDLVKIAYMKKTSVNNLINSLLKDYADSEDDLVKRYIEIFK